MPRVSGEVGEPGVDDRVLGDFFELNTHADVVLAVHDTPDGVELAVLVGDVDIEHRARGQRVEHIEIAAFATEVAGAGLKARFGASLDDLS